MKAAGKRKTRLSGLLCAIGREELSEILFCHVVRTLHDCSQIARVMILSDGPPLMGATDWVADKGAGLNAELERVRTRIDEGPLLIIHADLPLLETADLDALLAAAEGAVAIAPDSHGTGTNALALGTSRELKLCFGRDSFARHHAQVPDAIIITGRPGLALDVDTADDLDKAISLGFVSPTN
jgi:2-phospho-L-lactate guanylyltransferase